MPTVPAKISPTERIQSPAFGDRQKSQSQAFNLTVGYAKHWRQTDKMNWYFGGLFNAQFLSTEFTFGFGTNQSYFYENSISPWLVTEYQINPKNRMRFSFHFPVLSFIARPEYAIVDNRTIQGESGLGYLYKKGELALIGDYLSLDLAVGFYSSLSNALDGFVRYNLNYWQYQKPEKLYALKNSIDLGLSLNF